MSMKKFANHKELSKYMMEMAHQGKIVYAVVFYEDAKLLLKSLCKDFEETKLSNIELHDPEYDGYNKEYYIAIWNDDDEYYVNSEIAYHENNEYHGGGYYHFGDYDTIALIHKNSNHDIFDAALGSFCLEFSFSNEKDLKDDKDENLEEEKEDMDDETDSELDCTITKDDIEQIKSILDIFLKEFLN